MWLGPPCMNMEIIALARAGRGGCFGRRSKCAFLGDLCGAQQTLFLKQRREGNGADAVGAGEKVAP